jgi:hypothetical protein
MHHPALALLTREVRLMLRGWTLMLVLLAVGVLLFFAAPAMLANARAVAAGRSFLLFAANFQVVLITLISAILIAGAVAEERASGSTDLLLMTGMSPFSLLAGLAGGRITALLATLAAQFPFLVMGITAGGVLPGQVIASFSVLAAHAILCTGLAVWIALETRTHAMAVAGLLATVFGGQMLAGFLGLSGVSAFSVLAEVFENPAGYTFPGAWCAIHALAGTGFFATACLRFRARAVAGAEPGAARANRRGRQRQRPAAGYAFFWLDRHFLYLGPRGVLLRFSAPLLIGVAVAVKSAMAGGNLEQCLDMAGAAICATAFPLFWLELAFQSARMYRMDLQTGTLDDLRAVPAAAEKLVNQKEHALSVSLLPHIGCWVIGALLNGGEDAAYVIAMIFPALLFSFLMHLLIAEISLTMGWWSIPLAMVSLGGLAFICMIIGGLLMLVTFGFGAVFALIGGILLYIKLVTRLRESIATRFLTPKETRWGQVT